jgi:non-specific protein-tyrosine kinase
METDRDEQTFVSLERALSVLRRRAPLILLGVVLVAGAALGYSKHKTKQYTATASLVFNNNQLSQQVAGLQAVGSNINPQSQQDTDVQITKLGDMAAKTARQLGEGLTEKSVRAGLSITAVGDTDVVDVAATSTSPALAAKIANTYSNLFVTEQQSSNQQYFSSALALVQKQLAALSPQQRVGPSGLALEDRAQSLGILAQLQSGNVQVAQAASVPIGASSPKVVRNIVLGAFLGLLLGLGVAVLRERLDRRIREPKDLEAVYRLPLLGAISESSAFSQSFSQSKAGRSIRSLPPSDAEAFRLIRARLRFFNVDREIRTLLIGSAAPGDGKTTIACHLAETAASMGSRVLLLELDLRRPTIARAFGLSSGPGVADIIIGSCSLRDAIQSVGSGVAADARSTVRTLDVLVAGTALPPNPGELLESDAMQRLLEHLKAAYDLVVIDTPPLTAVSDAFPLLHRVDGVVIVGRVGRNRRDIAARLHETLTASDAPLLGVIANGIRSGAPGSYAYGYGYSYAPDGGGTRSQATSSNRASPEEPASAVDA